MNSLARLRGRVIFPDDYEVEAVYGVVVVFGSPMWNKDAINLYMPTDGILICMDSDQVGGIRRELSGEPEQPTDWTGETHGAD